MTEPHDGEPEALPLPAEPAAEPEPIDASVQPGLREKLAKIPKVTEPEFRLACNEIAEELAGSWKFLWRVGLAMGGISAIILGILGWTVHDMAQEEMAKAKVQVDAQINDEFDDAKIKATVEDVASEKAADLLQKHVQPSIDEFKQHLNDQAQSVDKDVTSLRDEVAKLKARNEITALADAAIDKGDISAFRTLRTLAESKTPPDGAGGEFIRVFDNFSMFGPMKYGGTTLIASAIHPGKTKEEDLDVTDLLKVLSSQDEPAGRARAAELLVQIGKPGSYSTAKALVQAIQNENNLWVMKYLKPAFAHIVPYHDGGSEDDIDGQAALDWWKAHESEVQKADTDPKPNAPATAH